MSAAVKLDPIFGQHFGDHAQDCPCEKCSAWAAESSRWMNEYLKMRADLDALANPSGTGECARCGHTFERETLDQDGLCASCDPVEEER